MVTITLTATASPWTVPADCVLIDELVLVGAGGSGRGNRSLSAAGYGGGGGEERRITNIATTPNSTIPYQVGVGGAGTLATTGNNGTPTWFVSAGTYLANNGGGAAANFGGFRGGGGIGGVGSDGEEGGTPAAQYGGAAGGTGNGARQTTTGAAGNISGGGSSCGQPHNVAGTNPSADGARGEIRITYTPVVIVDLTTSLAETFTVGSPAFQVTTALTASMAEAIGVIADFTVSTPAGAGGKTPMGRTKTDLMFRSKPYGSNAVIG